MQVSRQALNKREKQLDQRELELEERQVTLEERELALEEKKMVKLEERKSIVAENMELRERNKKLGVLLSDAKLARDEEYDMEWECRRMDNEHYRVLLLELARDARSASLQRAEQQHATELQRVQQQHAAELQRVQHAAEVRLQHARRQHDELAFHVVKQQHGWRREREQHASALENQRQQHEHALENQRQQHKLPLFKLEQQYHNKFGIMKQRLLRKTQSLTSTFMTEFGLPNADRLLALPICAKGRWKKGTLPQDKSMASHRRSMCPDEFEFVLRGLVEHDCEIRRDVLGIQHKIGLRHRAFRNLREFAVAGFTADLDMTREIMKLRNQWLRTNEGRQLVPGAESPRN